MNTMVCQSVTVGEQASTAIEKAFQKATKYEQQVLKDKDPEYLHQMRVGMRRLRSIIRTLAVALELPTAASDKKIGKVARRLGTLRDLDVLMADLSENYLAYLPTKEQKQLQKSLQLLEEERQDALAEVRSTLKSKRYLQMKQQLQEWLAHPQYRSIADMPLQSVLPDLLGPTVSQLFLHPGWWVGVRYSDGTWLPDRDLSPEGIEGLYAEQGECLHDLRKQVKRVRYQLSLCAYPEDAYKDVVQEMKQIQDVLGAMQDSLVLEQVLTQRHHRNWQKSMPVLSDRLQQVRQQYWQQWQNWQQRYLLPQVRQQLRERIIGARTLTESEASEEEAAESAGKDSHSQIAQIHASLVDSSSANH
jgi:CHAD domain-containing protein